MKNSIEVEVRFYFSLSQMEIIIEKLKQFNDLTDKGCSYEKTLMYDNPNPSYTFYSKEIDGRFRVRISKHTTQDYSKCMVSWKRRLNKSQDGVHKEEEVELKISFEEYENLNYLLENVLKMKRVESYERYRHIFSNNEIEICVDKFPFGIALEIELKKNNEDNIGAINKWIEKLNLKLENSYKLSCDDKYNELCLNEGKSPKKDILFDDIEMPFVNNAFA